MQKLKQIFLIFLFGILVVNPSLVMAQSSVNVIEPQDKTTNVDVPVYQNVQDSITNFLCTPSEPADGHDLERCINKAYRFGVAFGAIALVFFVVLAGYFYMTGGESGKTKAKGILQNALVGMGLLLGSYVLLSFINPDLVVFRPIQPPIFDAAAFPDCETIGFGADCVVKGADGSTTVISGGYASCSDGLVPVTSITTNGGGDDSNVCKTVLEKLKQINQAHPFTITQTFNPSGGGPSSSSCHKGGNQKTGVCADIVSKSGDWDSLCSAVKSAGMVVVNESGHSSTACGTARRFDGTTGNHLHIYLPNS